MTPPLSRDLPKRSRGRRSLARAEANEAMYATLLAQNPLVPVEAARKGKAAWISLRQSKDSNLLGEGVERQYDHCWAKALMDDLDVIGIVVDNDLSAKVKGVVRPGYERMVAALREGQGDIILALTQDRLIRQPRDLENLIDIAEQRPLAIHGTIEAASDLRTAAGRHAARQLAGQAAFEGDRRVERQKIRNAYDAKLGNTPTTPLFGYSIYKKKGKWACAIDPEESAIVIEIYQAVAAGMVFSAIAEDLNNRGIPTNVEGRPWDHNKIRNMMGNRRYLGERWLNGEFVTKGNWEPILTQELFDAAVAEKSTRSTSASFRGHKTIARKYVGTGLFLCGECDSSVRAGYKSTKTTQGNVLYPAYLCREADSRHISRRTEEADRWVLAQVADRLRQQGVLDALLATEDHAAELAELREAEAEIERKATRAKMAFANEDIEAPFYRELTTGFRAELDVIRARRSKLSVHNPMAVLGDADDAGDRFLSLPITTRARIIERVATVRLLKSKKGKRPVDWHISQVVQIDWKM